MPSKVWDEITYPFPNFNGEASIPALINNHMPSKVGDEMTYPFPNFNGAAVEGWESISNFIPHIMMDVITYPSWD